MLITNREKIIKTQVQMIAKNGSRNLETGCCTTVFFERLLLIMKVPGSRLPQPRTVACLP